MGAFRALLIGAGEFGKDSGFDSLPAIPGDLDRMDEALCRRGYECTRAEHHDVSNATHLDKKIRDFIKTCKSDDTGIVYFTGHGIKYEGVDYLVPAGVSREEAKPGPQLVRTDNYYELADKHNSGHILILIDACRDPGDAGKKGDKTIILDSSSSRLVRMFGCSPGERCWTNKDNQSVFSAAFVATLTEGLETQLPGVLQESRSWCQKLAGEEDRIQAPRLDPDHLDDKIAAHNFFPAERKKAGIKIGNDEKLWVVVLKSDKSGNHFTNTVRTSLEKSEAEICEQTQNKELDLDLRVIEIDEALQSPQSWLEVIQALCKAPVVVVDAMDFQPGIMLLLGIRAVVMRGVTLTVTTVPVKKWKSYEDVQLPFNIQELKLIGAEEYDIKHPQHPNRLIGTALADGLRQLNEIPTYQDLPGFDDVRCNEPSLHAHSVQNTVFVLCPFGNTTTWKYMSPIIEAMSTKLIPGTKAPEVVRMLDMESARLVGPALYEHIRWSRACIVDLTEWRPNVLFELGVRLTCSGFVFSIEDAPISVNSLTELFAFLIIHVERNRAKQIHE
ncbi:MAG: caspase family protein [Candidatus Thiodiazotropha lotti]